MTSHDILNKLLFDKVTLQNFSYLCARETFAIIFRSRTPIYVILGLAAHFHNRLGGNYD
jgi:hypothetical protein